MCVYGIHPWAHHPWPKVERPMNAGPLLMSPVGTDALQDDRGQFLASMLLLLDCILELFGSVLESIAAELHPTSNASSNVPKQANSHPE